MVFLTRTELIDKRYNFFSNNISREFSMNFSLLSEWSIVYINISNRLILESGVELSFIDILYLESLIER